MAQNVAADYTVDYGDGTIETFSSAPWTAGNQASIASHSYSNEGIYQLTLTAEIDCDGDGLADPDLYTDNLSIIVGNVVQQWDYGDNTPLDTSTVDLCTTVLTPSSHSYTKAGTYTATYKAVDYNNNIISDSVEVIVTAIADHYAISHSGTGLTCEASLVTVTAHDINHAALDISSNASITITTTPAVDSIISSPLSILAGTSSATFYLAQSTVSSIDINVTDGNSTELTGAAIASEDLPLNFTNTAFRFIDIASLSTLAIGKQIGSKPSSTAPGAQNIGLQAIRTDTQSGACTTAFANVNTAVNFAYECNNPSSCQASGLLNLSANSIYSTGIAIAGNDNGAVSNYTAVTMNFDANGIAPLSFLYDDVGQITLYATKTLVADNTTTPPISAATLSVSGQFIVRPFGFTITVTGNPAASSSTGSVFRKAGEAFTASAQAVLYQAIDDSDNDGIPDGHNDSIPSNNTSLSDNALATNFGNEISSESILLSATLVTSQ
ncbi:PKD domain-containing protein [sulfur-oxidizing endosymbiont of Gigantopelta aegis]|uniref:PKD domain-containing protein n=1 Tax=sulfur-oxidizing endosymbiont of Gigantopelta aegis TaxID=2794934 RepID=UPI0018DB15F0|nr:PKD domain-containing protein [sulfur-oxidizing endosymbiont of Gigantopelta aegis]